MCRIRSDRRKKRRDDVQGIQRIALRGPGCIDGTGQCEGVLGTGRRICCEEVLGTGDRRCEEVLGTGGRRCEEVLGTGSRRCDNVMGTGGRFNPCRHRDKWLWNDLETPTTVPR